MKLLEWTTKTNSKLNYRFFPKSQTNYVTRFCDLASTLSQNAGVVLHLGSGPKDLSAYLGANDRCVKLINLDIGLPDLRKNPGCLKVCADAERLPLPPNHVDAICSEHVFEHFADPGRILEECFRILKPGGKLLVSGPNGRCYIALAARLTPLKFHHLICRINTGGRVRSGGFQTFYRFSTPRTMCRLARKSGFTVTTIERFVGAPCYTTFLPVIHMVFIVYHLTIEKLSPLFGFHITSVAVFRKPEPLPDSADVHPALTYHGQLPTGAM